MTRAAPHKWTFKARFRRGAFGWRSQPAIKRVREAVREIKKVARKDPRLGASGAVLFLERLSPALEHVDSSSGAIGTAVNKAIEELVGILATAPVTEEERTNWLDRLFEALVADRMPYLEDLGDHWGELCGTIEIASHQADKLLDQTRLVLSPGKPPGLHFAGTSACLSALFRAERYDEILELTKGKVIWPYKVWAVRALAAQGKRADALRLAESCRSPWASDLEIDRLCEEILLSSGMVEEAYQRHGLTANRGGTYLATFRAVAKRYPDKEPGVILADLVRTTPGDEGKWFAAAKSAGLYENAIALAKQSPCDPKTLTRAARDFAEKQPEFALGAGSLALHWLVQGYGYEITGADVRAAYDSTMRAASQLGRADEIREWVRKTVSAEKPGERFVSMILGRELGLR